MYAEWSGPVLEVRIFSRIDFAVSSALGSLLARKPFLAQRLYPEAVPPTKMPNCPACPWSWVAVAVAGAFWALAALPQMINPKPSSFFIDSNSTCVQRRPDNLRFTRSGQIPSLLSDPER